MQLGLLNFHVSRRLIRVALDWCIVDVVLDMSGRLKLDWTSRPNDVGEAYIDAGWNHFWEQEMWDEPYDIKHNQRW